MTKNWRRLKITANEASDLKKTLIEFLIQSDYAIQRIHIFNPRYHPSLFYFECYVFREVQRRDGISHLSHDVMS